MIKILSPPGFYSDTIARKSAATRFRSWLGYRTLHAMHVFCRPPRAKRSNATAGGVLPHDAQASSSWVRGTGVAWDDVRAGAGSSTRGRLRVDVVVRGTSRPFASTGFVLRRAWTSDHNSNEFQQ